MGDDPNVHFEADLDALFKLPLAEFTVARNNLATRLKKAGHGREAERAKTLVKPSVSAWTVNQLYWRHRDAFQKLIAAGERVTQEQARQLAGKAADMPEALAARRNALSALSVLAGELLRETGHNAASETMRRITTTLEALSIYSSFDGAPTQGRLSQDVDPPGFESLSALLPRVGKTQPTGESTRVAFFRKAAADDGRTRGQKRQAGIASRRAALESAERTLERARAAAHEALRALKETTADADDTEKKRREAEQQLEKTRLAAQEARHRLKSTKADAEEAAMGLRAAERAVEQARRELESLQIANDED